MRKESSVCCECLCINVNIFAFQKSHLSWSLRTSWKNGKSGYWETLQAVTAVPWTGARGGGSRTGELAPERTERERLGFISERNWMRSDERMRGYVQVLLRALACVNWINDGVTLWPQNTGRGANSGMGKVVMPRYFFRHLHLAMSRKRVVCVGLELGKVWVED